METACNCSDRIFEERPDTRALLSSGYTDKHNVIKLLQDKPIAFLQKPYSLPILLSTVHKIVNGERPALEVIETNEPRTRARAPPRRPREV